ncbi:DUF3467 domain-containing protein [Marinobacterium sediminicola]|uniref:DUF3467 domain-containing protein n=1 Tax=Marinobacterium sediminicola TaxID=518898 RepID=A0ABY1S3Y2_9GAMM|nr:DUF3467 domain-containing protein [Marinobacterium sediminicola]ULG68281.1 DUF3467 domain-containing protein [Marinobacterium sediminicola]SMR77749.1 Protein of unknown function [Marinobacterium sediminicola]
MSEAAEQKTMNEQPSQQPVMPKIKWNDTNMQSTYANVCNVMGTREEIMVLFGSNKSWQGGQEEVEVMLSQRILLTPYAAKRLQIMLDMGLKEYEKRFGEIKL